MLDLLTVVNSKEFYPLEALNLGELPVPGPSLAFVDEHLKQANQLILSNRSGQEQSSEYEEYLDEGALEEWKSEQVYMHLLNLIKAFFKNRQLNGKNLFKVLAK
mmetsp:Transcript_12746/g.12614  ORF Transcript_12746/g.12614 Transcript_12746/m.12614 type:complete len:104 (-) Transcript_12746:310-621(-)